ncbi:hypothetical protein [Treponema endosymbiont of Eucomonympha sp.]|uniref:hypothetical protein n=1 Tax=Treponema endosymbiont of Eucomonympha sp. TaxID=1580831 RepID=UPI001396B0D5|nr:hypothetical protein [Treponema endosymbiont of Eucomonympha sp.]
MQSSPLPSSPPFMSGVYSSIFQSTLPRLTVPVYYAEPIQMIVASKNGDDARGTTALTVE